MELDIKVSEGRGDSWGTVWLAFLLVALAAGALLLGGCESRAARLEAAKADRALAEAQAHEIKLRAQAALEAERAALREAARENGHQRALEVLPFVLALAICLAVVCLSGVLAAYPVMQRRQSMAAGDRWPPGGSVPLAPPVTQIFVLPPQPASQKRADYWREFEAAAREQSLVVVDQV